MNVAASAPMVKVFFEPPDDPTEDWHTKVESMWASVVEERSAPGGKVYRLENSPLYAFGVSFEDDVLADSRHEVFEAGDGFECDRLYFTKVWKHSGHSTYTLFLQGDTTLESPTWISAWDGLEAMGCSYEGMSAKLFAVDVPPAADLARVEEIFEKAAAENVFAYQTQHRFLVTNEAEGSI